MKCESARELIEGLVDGRIDAEAEKSLRAHCERCAECAAALAAAESFVGTMTASFGDARPAPELRQKIVAAIGAERAPRRFRFERSHLWTAGAAAAAVIAAALAFIISSADNMDSRVKTAGDPQKDAVVASAPVGTVLAGELEVRPSGAQGFVRAAAGRELVSGDTVRAGGDLPAEISLSEVITVFIDAGSEIVVAPDPALPYDVRLERGQVFAEVTKGTPFRVLTAGGEVQSLGTRFGVQLLSGVAEFAVVVEEGVVRVDSGGSSERVSAGESVLAAGGRFRREGAEGCGRRLGWVKQHRERRRGRFGQGGGHGAGQSRGRGEGAGHGKGKGEVNRERGREGEGVRDRGEGSGHGKGQGEVNRERGREGEGVRDRGEGAGRGKGQGEVNRERAGEGEGVRDRGQGAGGGKGQGEVNRERGREGENGPEAEPEVKGNGGGGGEGRERGNGGQGRGQGGNGRGGVQTGRGRGRGAGRR